MPVVAVINSRVFLYSITSGGHTFKCLRIDFKLRALNRGARNAICLILINRFGSICSANSFRNLTDQFLRHILPPYFQKSRYYGLHASATLNKYKDRIDQKLLQNRDSISQLFAVIKTLMKAEPYACEKCQSTNFQISEIKKNTVWIFYFIILSKLRGPPKASSYPKKASA